VVKQLRVVAALCALSGIASATVAFSMQHRCSPTCGTMLFGTGGEVLLMVSGGLLAVAAGLALRSVLLSRHR